jgi:hypothetical protein
MAIDFVGFTGNARIVGQIPLADDRLSDMLNSVARVVVRGATLEDLDTGRTDVGDVPIPCGDFLVVAGTGRRGLENLRKRTIQRRVVMSLGRFTVTGSLHVSPSADAASRGGKPDELLVGRDLLVPLTEATVEYERAGKLESEAWQTLLVNRARARWIEAADDAMVSVLADDSVIPRRSSVKPRWIKDFTPVAD